MVQVNLCQKLLFLHQLTHYMMIDCSLNYKFNTWKFQAQNMERTCYVQKLFLTFRTIYVHNMFSPMFCKNKSFWQRFTCTDYKEEDLEAIFQSFFKPEKKSDSSWKRERFHEEASGRWILHLNIRSHKKLFQKLMY